MKEITAFVTFKAGEDAEGLEARVRGAIETHPTLSFRVDGVVLEEGFVTPDGPTPPGTGPAFTILRDVIRTVDGGSLRRHGARTTWTVAADTVRDVLRSLITGRVRFTPGDWKAIEERLIGGRWGSDRVLVGADGGESWYRLACTAGNASAAASFEQAKGRKPFRARPHNGGHWGYGGGAQLDRLSVGATFLDAAGQVWTVTSFASAEEIVACRYEDGRRSPVQRKRLGHEALAKLIGGAS